MVTGGTGFIGQRLVEKLSDYNTKIIVLGRNRRKSKIVEELVDKGRVEFLTCDLSETSQVEEANRIVRQNFFLLHLASYMLGSSLEEGYNAIKSIAINVEAVLRSVDVFKQKIIGIVYISTVDVYGTPTYLPIDEKHSTNPLTFYGASKLAGEKYLQVLASNENIPLTILRFSEVYGPGEWHRKAIPNFIRDIISDKPPTIFGDGSDVRDYVYLDDAVGAIISSFLERKEGIYNIAGGQGISIRELATKLIKLAGSELSPNFLPSAKPSSRFVFDISKAQKELDFYPQFSLDEGLKAEIDWFRSRRDNVR
ncbi:MAG: NAD-dependent epimerase/dehydratase family protein [Anaerolineae bacterium]